MTRTLVLALLTLSPVAFAEDAAETAKKLDALYAQRNDPAQLKELEKATEAALAAFPNDYGILWRASRLKYWEADGATHEKIKAKLGRESWELGERAVKVNSKGVEGHYYAGIGLGAYSQGVGVLTALSEGLEGKFNAHVDAAVKMNPAYDNAGPLIAKGRYWYELPWPKRDLEKSKETLKKAIQTQPAALRAWLYLAETQLKDGDAKAAKASIDKVLAGAESYDPPEARRVKARAKSVAEAIARELD
ncbi:MAG: hypothetical protein IRZ16_05550 [Myxococcaceae bacterium]|nr:hypothetical protein [Myxococcaceae bacterium]